MGVPYFFGWLLRKYRKNNIITQYINKEIDVLYLDSNCLFHPQCFKILSLHKDINSNEILENKMFNRILEYIDFLIDYCNPKKEVYISVDGVAPLAKMNQQRKRRFRSIQDKIIINEIKKKYKKNNNNKWSNTVITPGTEFMEKLNNRIIDHFKKKKNKKIKITLSSYHVPGEGEHKILNDIREKTQYNKNNTYVIYGLDADLIFLALASQKSNIYLLREETEVKKKNTNILKDENSIEEELIFVSIDEMKKSYVKQIKELIIVNSNNKLIGFNFDENRLISDFIFISFFLGNDFLPHIPSINIRNYGLDNILDAYVKMFHRKKNYILDETRVNINNNEFIYFIKILKEKEDGYFRYSYPKYKERNKKIKCRVNDPYEVELWNLNNMKNIKINDPIKLGSDESNMWKFRYYEHHFNESLSQENIINDICNNYIDGLKWVLLYYFKGCNNWTWQYVYSHGAFISDIYYHLINKNTNINNISFEDSNPSKPFEQLLAVLPPQCDYILPKSYKKLVNNYSSPIIEYYPIDIDLDLLDHKMYWECVPLLPTVDINNIKEATKKLKLTKEEKIRNEIHDNLNI